MASIKDMGIKAADIFWEKATGQKGGNALAAPCTKSKPEITDLYIAQELSVPREKSPSSVSCSGSSYSKVESSCRSQSIVSRYSLNMTPLKPSVQFSP